MHFSCLAHALHIATTCTHLCHRCHALLKILFTHLIDHFSSLACHVYFMFCSILFLRCFVFCLSFISFHYPCSYLHFPPPFLSICLFLTKRGECCHFYMTLVHIHRGRNSIGRCIYQEGEDIVFMRRTCAVLFYIMFVFFFSLWCFELLLVSMICCSHRIVFMCWTCRHSLCLVLYWLHVWMIICIVK